MEPSSRRLSQDRGTRPVSRVGSSDLTRRAIPPIVHDVVRSPGQPLDAATRGFMEMRFGHDFGHVRVHADRRAAESTRAVDARAYTLGRDTVFGEGQYAPETAAGRRMLAHELAHTLQGAKRPAGGVARISDPEDSAEHDADRAASDAIAGRTPRVTTVASAGTLHRQALPDFRPRTRQLAARLIGSEVLEGFALEGYALTPDHKGRLAVLAQTLLDLLRDYPGGTVRIVGHTDATGEEPFNERLGQKRADAVSDFLIEAGLPAAALATVSAGESHLRIQTRGPEPRNRRVEVHFDPQSHGRLFPGAELTRPGQQGDGGQPTPPVCIAHPEQCLPVPPDPGVAPCSASTECAAVSVDRFDKQPAVLRRLISRSFEDPAAWFEGLDPDRRFALTAIFNRLCRYGLLCHVRTITSIRPGEAPVWIGDLLFRAPGSTPSVFFTSPDVRDVPGALIDTGRFCMAAGIGASQHPGPSFREISGSDSLHVSIEKGELEAHIDLYSPVPEPPGSTTCSNAPSPAAVGHIGRELAPGKIRGGVTIFGVHIPGPPGVQIFPEPPPPAPVPPGAVAPEPYRSSSNLSVPGVLGLLVGALLEVTRLTLRGPVRQRQRAPDIPPLPDDIERRLAQEIPARIRSNALVPAEAERALAEATRVRDQAGPDEERRLIAALEAARERVESFAQAHEVAKDMARRMGQARNSGRPDFALPLGSAYATLSPPARKALLDEVRDMARIVRTLLGGRAAGVYKIWVVFGENVMWDVMF